MLQRRCGADEPGIRPPLFQRRWLRAYWAGFGASGVLGTVGAVALLAQLGPGYSEHREALAQVVA